MGDKNQLPTHLFYGCVGKMRATPSEKEHIEEGKKLSAHRNTAKEIARSNDALNKSNQEIMKMRKKKPINVAMCLIKLQLQSLM